MKIIILPLICLIFILSSCSSVIDKNPVFGTYYEIGDLNIFAPFKHQPEISKTNIVGIGENLNYQYAYPNETDDDNWLYGIEILSISKWSNRSVNNEKLKQIAEFYQIHFETNFNGELIEEKYSLIGKKNFFYQKMKCSARDVGSMFINSYFVINDKQIIRIFIYTQISGDGNDKILKFCKSILFD